MKCLVLLSGGLDSAVILARYPGSASVTFNYGQRHGPEEISRAEKLAHRFGSHHEIVDIRGALFGGLASSGSDVLVPGRNAMFFSLATPRALRLGASEILYGANADDYRGFPDCRPDFVNAYNEVLSESQLGVVIAAPLVNRTKAQIITEAAAAGLTDDDTWSCYDPTNGAPCFKCGACLLRY